jgi:putative addiction module component (TIGR02574 family)
MNVAAEQLLTSALALSDSDRAELADAILASLHSSDHPPFDEAWREVIQRRSAELDSGRVIGVPWEEVKRQARERSGG